MNTNMVLENDKEIVLKIILTVIILKVVAVWVISGVSARSTEPHEWPQCEKELVALCLAVAGLLAGWQLGGWSRKCGRNCLGEK